MKFLDKLALKIFSLIVFAIAILIILVLTGIVNVNDILNQVVALTDGENTIKITIAVLAVLMLLAIKGLFFTSKSTNLAKEGIILENANGKLVISKESLDNLISSVIKDIPGAEVVSSKNVLDKNKDLDVFVTIVVSKDVMIKEITNDIQLKIKDAMKRTADLDVNNVNVKIKNISSKKVKGLPAPGNNENNSENEENNNEKSVTENVTENPEQVVEGEE